MRVYQFHHFGRVRIIKIIVFQYGIILFLGVSKGVDLQNNLRKTVSILAHDIGSRGYLQVDALNDAANYIISELKGIGFNVSTQPFEFDGIEYNNIIAEMKGSSFPERVYIIGAHYDTVMGTPGADDNASGVAGLIELARLLKNESLNKTVRFLAFTLEEPPFFRTEQMGSYVYAKSIRMKKDNVVGMISLEMIGYFVDSPESQYYPLPFFKLMYPDIGNFIAFVSNFRSRPLLLRAKEAFKKGTDLPVETLSSFSAIPGVDFSDHRSFWKFGYDAFMVTDTAFYRNPNYHINSDLPETLDYIRMSKVVSGLAASIKDLAMG